MPRSNHLRVFAQPGYRRLWCATAIAELGGNVGRMAFLLLVHELAMRDAGASSVSQVAVVMMLETLPMLLLGPIAGALVDRSDRRWLLIGCNAVEIVLLLSIPWLASLESRAPLYAAALVFSSAAVVFHPTRQSLIPDLVPRPLLPEANAISTMTSSLMLIGGTMLAAPLIGLLGKQGCFRANAATFFVSGLFLVGLSAPRHGEARHIRELLHEVAKGVSFLARHRELVFLTFAYLLCYAYVGAWWPLLPSFVASALAADPDEWVPLIIGAFGIGGILGGMLVPSLARRFSKGRVFVAALVASGVLMFCFGYASGPVSALAWAVAGGALIFSLMVMDATLVQERVPAGMRGRAFGAREPMRAAGMLGATTAILALSDAAPPGRLMVGAGLVFAALACTLVGLLPGARELWNSPDPASAEAEPALD